MSTFKNPFDPDNAIITQKVKEWVKKKFLLDEQTEITVAEMGCADPVCPCIQTSICVHKGLSSFNFQINKPLTYIRQWDFEKLSAQPVFI